MPFLFDDTLSRHLFRLGQAQYLEHGWGNIGQTAALTQLTGMVDYAERHRIGGMGGERGSVVVHHLVSVAMVAAPTTVRRWRRSARA